MADIDEELKKESLRIEEDAEFSAKGHFAAAEFWDKWHVKIGLGATIFAALAGASVLKETEIPLFITAALALIATLFSSVATFLNPSKKASEHLSAANNYLSIRNRARLYRNIELPTLETEAAKNQLLALSQHKDELNTASPQIPGSAYEQAKKNIAAGQTQYAVDEELNK